MVTQGGAASDGRFSARDRPLPAPEPGPRPRRLLQHPAVATLATAGLTIFVAGLYLVALHVSLEPPPVTTDELAHRDGLYFAIHGFVLVIALAAGFSLGKWINGLGFAFAALLFALVATFMAATQVASYELACRGHNELVRHWQC